LFSSSGQECAAAIAGRIIDSRAGRQKDFPSSARALEGGGQWKSSENIYILYYIHPTFVFPSTIASSYLLKSYANLADSRPHRGGREVVETTNKFLYNVPTNSRKTLI
jgi:hypothetical protein